MARISKASTQVEVKRAPPQRVHPAASKRNGRAKAKSANGHAATQDGLDLTLLLEALQSVRVGDFSVRLPGDRYGLAGKVADTFNEIVAANERMAKQLEEVGQVVGREGKTRKRVNFGLSLGAWGEMESSVNTLIDDLVWPIMAVTRAIAAVARGDLL